MKLSRRLQTILSVVLLRPVIADIGTDHALIPAALLERGMCEKVIATDLREGPLEGARALIEERGLGGQVELRQGDGLKVLQPGEADVIIITGMGGALMQRILKEGEAVAKTAKRLILSPQSELPEFRRFLQREGYLILLERVVEEDGKFYFILPVVPCSPQPLTEEEIEFGVRIEENDYPDYKKYLERELNIQKHIYTELTERRM